MNQVNLEVVPTNAEVIGRIVCPGGEPCSDEPPYHAIWIEIRNDEIGNSTELNPEYGFILPIPDGRYEMMPRQYIKFPRNGVMFSGSIFFR